MPFTIEITAGRWIKVTRSGVVNDLYEAEIGVIKQQILEIAKGTNLLVGGIPKAVVDLLIRRAGITKNSQPGTGFYRSALGQRAPGGETLFPATAKVAEKE